MTERNDKTEQKVSLSSALVAEGYWSHEQVKAWADTVILEEDEPDSIMFDISLYGTKAIIENSELRSLQRIQFSFIERFALKITRLDRGDEKAIYDFAKWLAYESIGEDISVAEVRLGYEIDELMGWQENFNPLPLLTPFLQTRKYKDIEQAILAQLSE